jgi:hypothetical protein
MDQDEPGMTAIDTVQSLLYLTAGGVLGLVYFLLLHATLRLHTRRSDASILVILYVGRVGGAILAFWAVAQAGALPLLLALAGFLAARLAVSRMIREA